MTLTNALKKYRTEVVITAALVVIFTIIDVLANLPTVNYEPGSDSFKVPTWVNKSNQENAFSEGMPLQNYFATFEQPDEDNTEVESESTTEKGLSEEEQSKQEGLLKQLYIGEYKYKLLAIVNEQKPTALLQKSHLENEKASVVSLNESDMLEPYKVNQLTARQVTLVDTNNNERTIYLRLFVPAKTKEQENGSKN